MEAIGAVAEETDLVVHALCEAIGDALFEQGDDPGEVSADRSTELGDGEVSCTILRRKRSVVTPGSKYTTLS